MDIGKIERVAVRAVEAYIDKLPNLEPIISKNDKTPFWDGDINVYEENRHTVENFFARVPLQVKGTTNTDDKSYIIKRDYLVGYKADRGCIFFLVQMEKDTPKHILYSLLSSDALDILLRKETKTIKIDLNELPNNPHAFERMVFNFATKRKGEIIGKIATKEKESLFKKCEVVEKHLDTIEDDSARNDLKSLLDTIKKIDDDGTVGSHDRFAYYSQKTLKMVINNHLETGKTNGKVKLLDTGKIERAAVRAVEEYIDKCSQLVPNIFTNDKTPFWDGEIFVYRDNRHSNDNFVTRVPVQVKGTANTKDDFYRIEREYLEGYKNDRGCILFLVQERKESSKILYSMLSKDNLNTLLKQKTKTIKIDLKPILDDPLAFEKDVSEFARKRNGEKLDNPATKEIKSLVKKFEEVEEQLDSIEDKYVRYDLEPLLSTIKKLKDDGTVGWRDKFVYYSQKAIELVINNIKGYAPLNLLFDFGIYLHNQRLYHLVENYYVKVLKISREQAKIFPFSFIKGNVATILINLGILHFDLNRPVEAEGEFKEALEISRELVKDNPKAYMGDVATILNNLGNLHAKHNRLDDAEGELEEALTIYRKLAKDNPKAYMGKLAKPLNNLAFLHQILNRPVEAEGEYLEALKLFRGLAEDNPDEYLGEMVIPLNNLGNLHVKLNRPYVAEGEFEEALEIGRKLAEDNPDAYLVDVAKTLNNLGNLHSDLNHPMDAEREYKEALDIRRELAKDNPGAYLGDVANTLNNLATLHAKHNRPDEAEAEYKEALDIRRKLALDNPAAYLGDVADTLNNLAILHYYHNHPIEAEGVWKEALEIYRGLAKDNPAAYKGDVAITLNNLAYLHYILNHHKEAEEEYQEVLEIRRELAEYNPAAHMGYVAITLDNLANLHSDVNRPVDAEKEYQEALEILRGLAGDNPAAYMGYLANTLNNLAVLHNDLNRPIEAEVEYQKVLEIRRSLAKDNPAAYIGNVADTLNNLANLHVKHNHHKEAEGEYNEALEIYRELAEYNPVSYMGYIAMTLNNLAVLHKGLNRPAEAEMEYNEALEIYRELAKDNPKAYMRKVSGTLVNMANFYSSQRDFAKAIDAIDQARAIMPLAAEY